MAVVNLQGRRSAAEVVLQPGEPCWYRYDSRRRPGNVSITRATFASYGAVRCVIEFDGEVAQRGRLRGGQRWRVVDPHNVYPREPEE